MYPKLEANQDMLLEGKILRVLILVEHSSNLALWTRSLMGYSANGVLLPLSHLQRLDSLGDYNYHSRRYGLDSSDFPCCILRVAFTTSESSRG
jgi:hypothetical protein